MSDRGISPEHIHPPLQTPPENPSQRNFLMAPIMRALDKLGMKAAQRESKTTAPLTSDQLIQMVRFGLDPNRADPSSLKTPEKEGDVDETTKQNQRLAVALNTLLFSFPPGEQQDGVKARYPEMDEELLIYEVKEKMKGYDDKSARASEIQAELTQLLTKAIEEVGGTELARFYFEFPGVTNDESLEHIRPIPQRWLETSLDANTLAPQTGLGIATKMGDHIVRDIAEGKSHWEDAAYAYLDREQVESEKALVAKLHAAHRQEPMMPEGHSHPHASLTIPDSRFQSLWRTEIKGVTRVALFISQWAEDTAHISLPSAGTPIDIGEFGQVAIDRQNIDRLNAFFSNERALPYIEVMLRLYAAAKNALDSQPGVRLQAQQRNENNNRKSHPEYVIGAESALNSLIYDSLDEEVQRLRTTHTDIPFPTNLANAFLSVMDNGDQLQLEYAEPDLLTA